MHPAKRSRAPTALFPRSPEPWAKMATDTTQSHVFSDWKMDANVEMRFHYRTFNSQLAEHVGNALKSRSASERRFISVSSTGLLKIKQITNGHSPLLIRNWKSTQNASLGKNIAWTYGERESRADSTISERRFRRKRRSPEIVIPIDPE